MAFWVLSLAHWLFPLAVPSIQSLHHLSVGVPDGLFRVTVTFTVELAFPSINPQCIATVFCFYLFLVAKGFMEQISHSLPREGLLS